MSHIDRVLPDPKWAIGKHALMNITARPRNGRTQIDPSSWRIPYQWQGTHYQDADDQPYLLLINSGGGFVEGDSSRLYATLEEDTRALITTTNASKFYKCPEGLTSEEYATISVGPGALLEYYPDEAIPFAGSRVLRRTHISLAESARLFATDMISAGRIHYGKRGEAFEFLSLDSEFRVDVEGSPVVIDRQVALDPEEIAMLGELWQGRLHQASVVCWGDWPDGIEAEVEEALGTDDDMKAGISRQDNLITCRILTRETWACRESLQIVWSVVRPHLAGKPARQISKC